MMSIIMTIVGGLISGQDIVKVLEDFFMVWPRNFCAAMFLNSLIAGPISRFVLRKIQLKYDKLAT
ncbi:hypothetical protein D3C71_1808780 [compost metagenome]